MELVILYQIVLISYNKVTIDLKFRFKLKFAKKALVLTVIDNMSSPCVIDSRTLQISPSTAVFLDIDSRILKFFGRS